jgi:hypothetical protein
MRVMYFLAVFVPILTLPSHIPERFLANVEKPVDIYPKVLEAGILGLCILALFLALEFLRTCFRSDSLHNDRECPVPTKKSNDCDSIRKKLNRGETASKLGVCLGSGCTLSAIFESSIIHSASLGILTLFFVALIVAWKLLIYIEENRHNYDNPPVAGFLFFTVVIVAMACGLEFSRQYFEQERLIKITRDFFLVSVLGKLFDPIPTENPNLWQYKLKPGSGLKEHVVPPDHLHSFQTFYSPPGQSSVQRLWADPRYEGSRISAWEVIRGDVKREGRLLVSFFRRGNGCDVTIRPNAGQAVYINPDDYKYLCVELKSHEECKENITFSIRIVDGRGTHWAWAKESRQYGTTAHHSISYTGEDAQEPEAETLLVRNGGEACVFYFDLTSRKEWAIFDADGGTAPPKSRDERIDFIQFVVIEPGLSKTSDPDVWEDYKLPGGHNRPLLKNHKPSADESKFYIERVYFDKKLPKKD